MPRHFLCYETKQPRIPACPFTRADRFRGRSYYENFFLVCSAPARMNRGTRLMGVYIYGILLLECNSCEVVETEVPDIEVMTSRQLLPVEVLSVYELVANRRQVLRCCCVAGQGNAVL